MKKQVFEYIKNEIILPRWDYENDLYNQIEATRNPKNAPLGRVTLSTCAQMVEDGWFDVYVEDMYAELKNMYKQSGENFRSEVYLKKDGGFRYKGKGTVVFQQYVYNVSYVLLKMYEQWKNR